MVKINLQKPRTIVSYNYSFLVTLPHEWLNYHKLNKGDKVQVDVDDAGNLIIVPVRA